jgi:hypothetical protein
MGALMTVALTIFKIVALIFAASTAFGLSLGMCAQHRAPRLPPLPLGLREDRFQ